MYPQEVILSVAGTKGDIFENSRWRPPFKVKETMVVVADLWH